jgi:hypothetical protein
MELDFSEQTKFGFIEDQDIDEIEQFSVECERRRWIEDGGRTCCTRA